MRGLNCGWHREAPFALQRKGLLFSGRERKERRVFLFAALRGEKEVPSMNLRKMATASLLLAGGLVLHGLTPPILLGMRPDFLLAMMFMVIIGGTTLAETLAVGLVSGMLTAITTTFPGGQVANVVDKIVTSLFVLGLVTLLGKAPSVVRVAVISSAGTVVSGMVFLGTAALLAGLPGSFYSLMTAVVLPAAAVNTVTVLVLYPVMRRLLGKAGEKPRGGTEAGAESLRK